MSLDSERADSQPDLNSENITELENGKAKIDEQSLSVIKPDLTEKVEIKRTVVNKKKISPNKISFSQSQ